MAFLTGRIGAWQIWIMEADGKGAMALFDSDMDGLTPEYAFTGERAIYWTR